MLTIGVYALLLLSVGTFIMVAAATRWPIQHVFIAVSWLPLFVLSLAFVFRDWLYRLLSYGVIVIPALIFVASIALTLCGSRLIARSRVSRERRQLIMATTLAASAGIVILVLAWLSN